MNPPYSWEFSVSEENKIGVVSTLAECFKMYLLELFCT